MAWSNAVAAAEVCGDCDPITGAGVRSSQRRCAHARVGRQGGRSHRLDNRGALPVTKLADVVVAFDAVDAVHVVPTQEDVAARLHEMLALHHSFAVR